MATQHDARQAAPLLLVVDDDPLFLRSVARSLSPLFTISTAASLAEAERLLAQESFDIVVSDFRLGAELGTDVLAAASFLRPTAHLVLTSGELPDESTWGELAIVAVDKLELLGYLRRLTGQPGWPNSQPSSERIRRRYPRISYRTSARLDVHEGSDSLEVQVKSVSCGGVLLVAESPVSLADRTQILVEVSASGQRFALPGFVAWTRENCVGIELDLVATPATVRHPWVHWVTSLAEPPRCV